MFETLLVANRGEIACRVIRTARRLGIRSVAVHSDADAGALHVRMADEAYAVGPAPSRESYLRGDRILAAAKRAGAQAIHPGYGFLSENADFAEACAAAGIRFVGPPPEAIRVMGSKDAAKRRMEKAGVPVVPGLHDDRLDVDRLREAASAIGYPVLLKAVAGGGGKGMRRVDDPNDLESAAASAAREAEAAFGDGRLLVERCIERPRHIEVQVFADAHGNAVHLFERDCSLQRRHQKVVEEAPAPGLDAERRAAMGEAAVRAARAIGYEGAGTVEFIVDVAEGTLHAPFYFMEMNTRLQVEHPVTEMVTGEDLVEWQLRVAAGEPLPRRQDEIGLRGHAIEVRLYAEDPARKYLPQTGELVRLRPPRERPGEIRVDSGVEQGDRISHHYDPMIAKLITHGADRNAARRLMRAALAEYEIAGVITNQTLLQNVIDHPRFASGQLDTGFLDQHGRDLVPLEAEPPVTEVALACAALLARRRALALPEAGEDPWSPWALPDGFRCNEDGLELLSLRFRKKELLEVRVHLSAHAWTLEWGRHAVVVRDARVEADRVHAVLDGRRHEAGFALQGDVVHLMHRGHTLSLALHSAVAQLDEDAAGGGVVRAPTPGRVVEVLVAAGDRVRKGQPLVRLEAMKMEHTLASPIAGEVLSLSAAAGDQVEEGATLAVVGEPAPGGAAASAGGPGADSRRKP